MKSPRFPLAEAIGWYMADAEGLEPSTLRRYRSCFSMFTRWLPEQERVLASVEPGRAERWVRTSPVYHSRMNRIIALRSFSRYLAERKIWYDGDATMHLPTLRDLKVPQPLPKGTPAYRDEEVRQIIHNLPETRTSLRTMAIVAVELHGFRAKEVRTMLIRNVVLPRKGEVMGHFIIDSRKQTKSNDGVRIVPMEPVAKDAVLRYLRIERPTFTGEGDEPLFLTEKGEAISEDTWFSLVRRVQREVEAETGIRFRQHRFRSHRVAQLHADGVPDSQIIELMGWEPQNGLRMLRRYAGRVPLSTLKRIPPSLDRLLGKAVA